MSLPTSLERVSEGEFISATHYNKLVDICEALVKGQGRNGITFFPASAGMVWRGSGSGSAADPEPTPGSAVAFRGRWNASTNYDEGDVVFLDGTAEQEECNAHTYVSKLSSNINQHPPDTTVAYEDTYWRVVAIGSWPTFVVSYPPTAPADERQVTIAPGAIQTHYSGSGGSGDATDDTCEIIGGVATVNGSLLVNGPVVIEFPDGTKVIINVADMDQPASRLNGKEFKLREVDVCIDGVIKGMGVICTEPYDLT